MIRPSQSYRTFRSQVVLLLGLIILVGCQREQSPYSSPQVQLVDFVDPFIGTGAHGHTFPGAAVPFGGVQVSPDNGVTGWDWCSGYHYSDSIIVGFSHLHLSGTGIGDLGDIRLMPANRPIDLTKEINSRTDYDYYGKYSHESEEARPGFYRVSLLDSEIEVALTTTSRSGLQRYTFPVGDRSIVLDLSHNINWDKSTSGKIEVVNDTLITGYRFSTGWAEDQRVYFAIAFSEPVLKTTFADSTVLLNSDVNEGAKLKALLEFAPSTSRSEILVRTGISSASEAGAILSLNESDGKTFDQVSAEAVAKWEKELSKITIKSDNIELKKTFYTAMYHASLAPVVYSDPNQEYKGAGGAINQAEGYTRYDIFSLWDTFRAAHPLFTITQTDKVNDMINSILAHYREYGLLPVWSLLGNETNTMTGYHAIPVITDAYFKGFTGFDIEEAYEAMKKSAIQDIRGVKFYKEYGFIPSDLEVESVTKNLEYAYDDWCIAQVARDLGKEDDYQYFMERAMSYKKLYDPGTGFMRGKLSDGSWRSPFDPKRSEHRVNTDYTEGNAWQHSWFVPHDIPGLIDLMGGNEAFTRKLDSLFSTDSEITGNHISADISGLIGQYAHGNEPSHHVAYLYNYAGAPWKTQEVVRNILRTQYHTKPDGLCGNDDCGQMSAWYVFSALGFYPVNPANGEYSLSSPLFDEATIHLPGGKTFRIVAEGSSDGNQYIRGAELNGKPLDVPLFSHEILMAGGELKITLGEQPDHTWGVLPRNQK
ncbi:MAG: GH92 family glycosyl hydrolase [Cytophagales bacterium]|nr:GH92 family glycosyl hydrolase [Cytophagales bacterium]